MDTGENRRDIAQLYAERGEEMFRNLYNRERDGFVSWAMRSFSCQQEDALEVFQQAMVVFHEQIVRGKITDLQASMKTYIYSIGRNLLLKNHHRMSRIALTEEEKLDIEFQDPIYPEGLTDEQLALHRALKQLGERCEKLLRLFYYRNYAIDAIAAAMDYGTEDVVRTKKYKCLKKLKAIIIRGNP